jgi:hypothetical protein
MMGKFVYVMGMTSARTKLHGKQHNAQESTQSLKTLMQCPRVKYLSP